MTTSSSSVPVLGPVLYFTQTDGYSYDVDNRPLFHLDTNIRHINTSLVGIGYGEHASLAGGLLTPGRIVTLFPNGSVYYPTAAPSTNVTENIVGLVIGATDSGLNRIQWASKHLDLDVLGLTNIVAGQASGSYITTNAGASGVISVKSSPISSDYVLGRIKIGSYIEINTASDLLSNDVAITVSSAVKDNHANMYGFTRFRNLLMYIDMGQTPMQYSKRTVYQNSYLGDINPMNVAFDGKIISTYGSDTTSYGTALNDYVLKERYTRFVAIDGSDIVSCGNKDSSWSTNVYNTAMPYVNGSENYELQTITMNGNTTGVDYTLAGNLALFKSFTIDKYYMYDKSIGLPTSKKLKATATVFNGLNDSTGGEVGRLIVWDFYTYNATTGFEVQKDRVITTGDSSENAITDTSLFPLSLINA